MKLAQKTYDRVKNILKQDKDKISEPFLKEIKSEIFLTLNQFFDVCLDDVKINYILNDNNLYELNINLKSANIKKTNFFN